MSIYDNAVAAFARLPGISSQRAEVHGRWFSAYLLISDALTSAVITHLHETAAADAAFRMPDVSDPATIVRTVFQFFDGALKEGDGLQLQLIAADSQEEHPLVKKGEKQNINHGALLNAMNMMLRVPCIADDSGEPYRNIPFDKRFFFHDLAGMENWLRVRATRQPGTNEMTLF